MKFQVEDKSGWLLAEGRLERNRAEARALVERLERDIKIEKLVKASRRAALAPVGDLHRRAGADGGPMASWTRPTGLFWAVSAWLGRLTWGGQR